jgi:hypothetical protein
MWAAGFVLGFRGLKGLVGFSKLAGSEKVSGLASLSGGGKAGVTVCTVMGRLLEGGG